MTLNKDQSRSVQERLARMSSAERLALRNLNNSFVPNIEKEKREKRKTKRLSEVRATPGLARSPKASSKVPKSRRERRG